jgi:hypothetical protein
VFLITKCDLFKNNHNLTLIPYLVPSQICLGDFTDFASALEDKMINIKDRNFLRVSELFEEFGFYALLANISRHRQSQGLADAQTAEFRSRISALEKCAGQHEDQLAVLQSGLSSRPRHVEADLAHLTSQLEAF